ncbi:hypothetical protein FXV83_07670 [Bradyrhizobium hipponense]|uniref:Uncharacterized protein n=1 Tax=Bradyrhizobium hipponense TaxID=2605638 RepID=A0A5S4YUN2_9BRAD|nr:DNA-primase RepB domain-containing protein [Bradyrhizobium hipponense]TYO67075.1 hypothetical protein FXV83_07670 [Bradyrhizobium hipponense]
MHKLYTNIVAGEQASRIDRRPTTIEFLKALFAYTTGPIYTCSFTNERGAGAERHVISRTPGHIAGFIEKWDRRGRGTFFCVSTQKEGTQKRNKENCNETSLLHADIDFKNVDLLGADPLGDVLRHLARLRILPSATVSSGNGVHAYWRLTEPLDTQENMERIESVLRQLADIVAGDLAVCEVSRVMRMPGSHNSRNGEWKEVVVTSFHPDRRYEFDDIEEWLSEQSPVMLRRNRERARAAGEYTAAQERPVLGETDFFAEYAKRVGFKPRVNVEQRLRAMMYMAGGENSIHTTQLSVAASLLNAGVSIDDVVERVLIATRAAAGEYGARWNWRREERKVRGMCETWLKKHPRRNRKPEAR